MSDCGCAQWPFCPHGDASEEVNRAIERAAEALRRCGIEIGSVGGHDYRMHLAHAVLAAVTNPTQEQEKQR